VARKIFPYNPKLVPLAKKLRKNSTLSEVLLWNRLKNNQLGFDFHRQKPIGNYIVDFYCPDLLLAIEIDGNSHRFKAKEDLERQKELEEMGVEFLRFTDLQVKKEIDQVVEDIVWMLRQLS
jgi:very-short-patch-repair endonuclease